MEFDKSTIAVSSEYFIKIVFSVPVQSIVYNVKRTEDQMNPCSTPVEMDRSPDNTPLNRTNCFLWYKKYIYIYICTWSSDTASELTSAFGNTPLTTEK